MKELVEGTISHMVWRVEKWVLFMGCLRIGYALHEGSQNLFSAMESPVVICIIGGDPMDPPDPVFLLCGSVNGNT